MSQVKFGRYAAGLACVLVFGLGGELAEAVKMKDDPNGFNGYVWEAALSKYPAMKLLKDLGSTDFVAKAGVYEIPGETVTLAGVTLTDVRYRFLDEQLESILLHFEGIENRDKLMQWLEEQYGKIPVHERRKATTMQWFGDATTATLKYEPSTKKGNLIFMSQVLNHRFNEFHQATQGD